MFPGRTYILVYRRVLAEDAGEIKFVAENAESRAQLRVKGETGLGRGLPDSVCEHARVLGPAGRTGLLSWGRPGALGPGSGEQ